MSIFIILIIILCPPTSSSSSSSSSLFPLSGPLHATGYKSDLRNRRPQSEKSRWTRKLSPLDFIWTITFLGKYIVLCVQMQVCGYFIYHILQLSKKGQLRFEFRDDCQSFFAVKILSICINKYVFDLLYKILSVTKDITGNKYEQWRHICYFHLHKFAKASKLFNSTHIWYVSFSLRS